MWLGLGLGLGLGFGVGLGLGLGLGLSWDSVGKAVVRFKWIVVGAEKDQGAGVGAAPAASSITALWAGTKHGWVRLLQVL